MIYSILLNKDKAGLNHKTIFSFFNLVQATFNKVVTFKYLRFT